MGGADMDLLLVLIATATFPAACLGFVLWMGRIEESIPQAVQRAVREPDPLPVLAIPVRRPVPPVAAIPAQRTDEAVAAPQRLEGSRSEAVSLGGSTNL